MATSRGSEQPLSLFVPSRKGRKENRVKSLSFASTGRNLEPGLSRISVFPAPRRLSCFGTSAGRRGLGAGAGAVVCPFVQAPAAGVHEEVADCGEFEAQLLRDGELHLFGRPLVLLEDGQQGAPLQVGEDQPRLLWCVVAILPRVLLLPLACWEKKTQGRKSEFGKEGK